MSLIFLSPFAGYAAAAALNNQVHHRFGQRGIAFIAGVCHLICYLTFSLHPPWPVMVVMFIFAGFGNGLADAAWCAWTGNMVSANKVQGFLQSFYSLGATISPLIATSMITQANLPWYTWYYVMVSMFSWTTNETKPCRPEQQLLNWSCALGPSGTRQVRGIALRTREQKEAAAPPWLR